MKEYTVLDNVTITNGGTESASVSLENPGSDQNYALAVKGNIPSVDVAVDVEVPGDAEVYDTALKGQSQLTGVDISDGGEIRSTEHQAELAVLRVADAVHVAITNNDASSGEATVKVIQYEND